MIKSNQQNSKKERMNSPSYETQQARRRTSISSDRNSRAKNGTQLFRRNAKGEAFTCKGYPLNVRSYPKHITQDDLSFS